MIGNSQGCFPPIDILYGNLGAVWGPAALNTLSAHAKLNGRRVWSDVFAATDFTSSQHCLNLIYWNLTWH